MKKSLLLTLAALSVGSMAQAEDNFAKVYENAAIQYISPNGQYAAGSFNETTTFFNLSEGKMTVFTPATDDNGNYLDYNESYQVGNGNVLSNTGILLCSDNNNSSTTYYENGVWKELSAKGSQEDATNCVNSITPDGSRICGSLGVYQMTIDEDKTMLSPCYWDRQADGTYSDPIMLPVPETVPLGRIPQYITANAISHDGKVIAGQITEYSGMLQFPIVYIQDENGEWSYKLPGLGLFNPDNVVLPEDPGEGPEMPSAQQYMSEEAKAAYDEAYAKYQQTWDPALFPNETDYLTPEQLAAYNEAIEKYNVLAEAYNEKLMAFYEAFDQILYSSPNFVFNNVFLSPDGKKYYVSNEIQSESFWDPSTYEVYCIDIETDAVEKYIAPGYGMIVTAVPDNDVVLGSYNKATGFETDVIYPAYIVKDGIVTPFADYLGEFSAEVATWMEENMLHEIEVYNMETGDIDVIDMLTLGIASASADLKKISFSCVPLWPPYNNAETALFELDKVNTGVAAVEAAKDAVAVSVYNVGGVCLLNNVTPAAAEAAQLAKGVYVVKTTYADGTVKSEKLVK